MPASRPVQNLATGFLSLLGIKNMGKLPEFLPDSVQPTIDMSEWYKFSNAQQLLLQETYAAPLSGVVIPQSALLINGLVPEGRVWWVHETSTAFIWDATDATVNAFGLMAYAEYLSQAGSTVLLGNPNTTSGAFSAVPTSGVTIQTPSLRNFFLPAGGMLGASVTHVSGTNPVVAIMSVRYTELLV